MSFGSKLKIDIILLQLLKPILKKILQIIGIFILFPGALYVFLSYRAEILLFLHLLKGNLMMTFEEGDDETILITSIFLFPVLRAFCILAVISCTYFMLIISINKIIFLAYLRILI